jgi:hypothetical protein
MPDTALHGELWMRASRVVESCDIGVSVTAVPPGWRVAVRPRLNPGFEVSGNAEHLVQAMQDAIGRAETAGYVSTPPRF